ncbi:MAG: Holliday junction branch migration DNA helicase RuvB [Bdellovibrionaceae bacterium]|nr:Holliday junction branch migration DNA helicase RuvB [Pseudobdellovibrionaceae bacterium]
MPKSVDKSKSEDKKQRLVFGDAVEKDQKLDVKLRPISFDEFPGQTALKSQLGIFVQAAKKREEPLDHILFCGPPGLGKTTLAHIVSHTMDVPFISTSGPALHRKGDLAAILTSMKPNSVFFIDEIHRLSRDVEEYLYSAMEDYFIDIVTGEGLGARSMRFQLAPFTLIGATTRAGLLKAPFRDRFGIIQRLQFYNKNELVEIINRSAGLLNIEIVAHGALELARRSRGTPRVANRLLKRVRDYAQVKGDGIINKNLAQYALNELQVDELGLDMMDQKILSLILNQFTGGPVGIDTLAASLSEESDTIEEVYEPFLIQEGLLQKTPRGRMITEKAKKHFEK